MWTSHAGGGGHGLPRAARRGTWQEDVKSATRGVLTGRPGSGACARMACGAAAAAVLCAKVLVVCVCGASAVSPSCGCCSVARKLVRSDLCRVWSPHLLEHINYSSLLRVSYRWVRAFRRRCLQRRRWRRRRLRPRSWKLTSQCRPRAPCKPFRRRRRSLRALPPWVRSHLRRVMSARTSWPRRSREFSQPMRT